jgi:hypothetical protein
MMMMDWLGKLLDLPDDFLFSGSGGRGGGVIQVGFRPAKRRTTLICWYIIIKGTEGYTQSSGLMLGGLLRVQAMDACNGILYNPSLINFDEETPFALKSTVGHMYGTCGDTYGGFLESAI